VGGRLDARQLISRKNYDRQFEKSRPRLGAIFEKVANWQPFHVVDGRLITGQNPASSTGTAKALMNYFTQPAARSAGAS